MVYDIIVIGGGTSAGFLLAFLDESPAGRNLKILALEKSGAPFRKIYASGNGRCNFSNRDITPSSYCSISGSGAWTKSAFEAAARLDLQQFFFDRGIPSHSDEFGRLMPYTNAAKTIGGFLERYLSSANLALNIDAEAVDVRENGGGYAVTYKIKNETTEARSRIVVYACGGSAYPQLGTDGTGFEILRRLGHTVTRQSAGIVPLETRETAFRALAGIKMECRITVDDFSRKGELLFTKYGFSGPNILYASNTVSRALASGPVRLTVDFLPEDAFTLEYFRKLHAAAKDKTIPGVFGGVLNAGFIEAFMKHNNLRAALPSGELETVYRRFKETMFTVTATRPLKEAQVSLGGVTPDEIDPSSFESKLHKNLFIMGEAIDYTGGCGGYNIHWCAATARGVADRISGMRINI